MNEIEISKCDYCGKITNVNRKYFNYNIQCECHSPNHFEMRRYCNDCSPVAPEITTLTVRTEVLTHEKEMAKNKPTPEEILKSKCLTKITSPEAKLWTWIEVIEAMQEYAELYNKERLRSELIAYDEYLDEYVDRKRSVLRVDTYLKQKE